MSIASRSLLRPLAILVVLVGLPGPGATDECRDVGLGRVQCEPGDQTTTTGTTTATANQPLQHTIVGPLPDNEPVGCEHEWTIRHLMYQPEGLTPRRMYFAGCKKNSDKPNMFVSFSLGKNVKKKPDPNTGAILQAELDPRTGKFRPVAIKRFKECIWMEGIAVSDDCTQVAALCRRRWGDKDFDHDALASHPNKKWMTQKKCAKQEMWLYEWNNGDVKSKPVKTVVHRSVDWGWEYGNNYLRRGDDGSYGIGIKARVFGGGTCHEADAFLVMDRKSHTYQTNRGWYWACGTGHTIFNRLAYNPATSKYAMMCGTDGSKAGGGLGGYWVRREDGPAKEFFYTNLEAIRHKGGPGSILPLPDGGFLGIITGVKGKVRPAKKIPPTPPTSIGLVRFNARARPVGGVKWIVEQRGVYLGYPQIADLGNGRFLLGYGTMRRIRETAKDWSNYSLIFPYEYYVREMDVNGRMLTKPIKVKGAGWGEQDQMVSLGRGRVGWAYTPDPALKEMNTLPQCNAKQLQLSVYSSPK